MLCLQRLHLPSICLNAGPYDQGCNETFQSCFKDYFDGTVDIDTAKKNFEDQIKVKYPELSSVEWPAAWNGGA